MSTPLHVVFVGGSTGPWAVESVAPYLGKGLVPAERLSVVEGGDAALEGAIWALSGTTSNTRYTHADEVAALKARQAGSAVPKRAARHSFPSARRRSGGSWHRTSAGRSSRRIRGTSGSASTI